MNIGPDTAPFKSNQTGLNATPVSSKAETVHLAKCVDVCVYSEQGTVGSVLFCNVAQPSWPSLQHCLYFIQDPRFPSSCKYCDLVS